MYQYKETNRSHSNLYLHPILCWGPVEYWETIINGLAQVPFEGVLVEAYKGTRRKQNMKSRQIDHTTSQYGQLFLLKLLVHGTGLLSLKLHHWLYLDHIFLTISVHPFRIIP